MANLITPAFFVGSINIPNIGTTKVDQRVTAYINQYEPKCLELVLGTSLYTSYLSDSTTQRMLDLKNGKDAWRGLVEPNNVSLIAYYVYFFMRRDMVSETTGTGEKIVEAEGTKAVSPAPKLINAWNEFSRKAQQLISFLWDNPTYLAECNWYDLSFTLNKIRPINSFGI